MEPDLPDLISSALNTTIFASCPPLPRALRFVMGSGRSDVTERPFDAAVLARMPSSRAIILMMASGILNAVECPLSTAMLASPEPPATLRSVMNSVLHHVILRTHDATELATAMIYILLIVITMMSSMTPLKPFTRSALVPATWTAP